MMASCRGLTATTRLLRPDDPQALVTFLFQHGDQQNAERYDCKRHQQNQPQA